MELTELEHEKVNNLLMDLLENRNIKLPDEDNFITEWMLYDFYNSVEKYLQEHKDYMDMLVAEEV